MESSKISRSEAIEKLAESVSPRGSIANIPGTFLGEAKVYLSLSDAELGQWYGVSRTNVLRKRSTVTERKKKTQLPSPQETQQAPGTSQRDPAGVDIPPEFCDMPTEEKIIYIARKYDRCIDNREDMSREQISAMQVRLADLRKVQAEEIQEGKEHINRLLNVIMKDFVRDFKAAFEASFSTLKADIASTALDSLWGNPGKLREILEAEDPTILKDSLKHQLLGTVSSLRNDFDVVQIYIETNKKHPAIKEQIEKYLAGHKHEAPRFVGGGSIAQEGSITGGAQARQKEIESKREVAARGSSINRSY